jgi:hypothetical protein
MNFFKFFISVFYIFSLIGCFSDNGAISQKKIKLEHHQFKYLSPEIIEKWAFFKKMQNSKGYILSYNTDSIPFFLNQDSLFYIDINKDKYVFYYNSETLKNTGIFIFGSLNFNKTKLFTLGEIKKINIFQIDDLYLFQLMENTGIFAFDNPQVLKEWFIVLNSNFEIISDLSIIRKGSVLLDHKFISINVDTIKINKNQFTINMVGVINNKTIDTSINYKKNAFEVPEELNKIKWNGMEFINFQKVQSKTIIYCPPAPASVPQGTCGNNSKDK